MKLLWSLVRILTPLFLAFSSVVFVENQKGLLVSACVAAIFSIFSFFSDAKTNTKHQIQIDRLNSQSNNLKNRQRVHNKAPHAIASAVIDIENPPKLLASTNVSDVVDRGIGDFHILVDTPFYEHLIPKFESDCNFNCSVKVKSYKDITCIAVKYAGGEPKRIYFSLISGDGSVNV